VSPRVLLDHFDLLAETPGGVARLREVVLHLAVRGKLVAQDPADEPASELLKRIAKERARLVKEGKIRAGKPLPPVGAEEVPFEVPEGWVWVRIEEVCTLVNGRAFKPSDWTARGTPIVRIQNLNNTESSYNYFDKPVLEKFYVNPGELLFAWSGTPGTSFGAHIWEGQRAILNQHIFRVLIDSSEIDRHYFKHSLNQTLGTFISKAHGGVGLKHITKGKFEETPIPLPPLAEQHRIVARVDELMALLDRLEAARGERDTTRLAARDSALATLRDAADASEVAAAWRRLEARMDDLFRAPEDVPPLRQAILQLAVRGRLVAQDPADEPASALLKRIAKERARLVKEGKIRAGKPLPPVGADEVPFEVPAGWVWCRLGELCSHGPSNGWSPQTVGHETAVKTLKLSATTRGIFDSSQTKFIDADLPKDSEYWLQDGDLLIQRSNTRDYVGMAALYSGPETTFIYPDLMMRCRIFSLVSRSYVHRALVSPSGREYLQARASGTSSSMVKINQNTVVACSIPLPPLAEQHRIVARVEELMALCDRLESRLAAAREAQTALAAAAVHHIAQPDFAA